MDELSWHSTILCGVRSKTAPLPPTNSLVPWPLSSINKLILVGGVGIGSVE
jgi:hypothetical protein